MFNLFKIKILYENTPQEKMRDENPGNTSRALKNS